MRIIIEYVIKLPLPSMLKIIIDGINGINKSKFKKGMKVSKAPVIAKSIAPGTFKIRNETKNTAKYIKAIVPLCLKYGIKLSLKYLKTLYAFELISCGKYLLYLSSKYLNVNNI